MGKPIQESIFKSRLTISYRVNISGTVQQESLPYRLLVLGEFSGKALREDGLLPDLGKREIKSIKRGTTVNDHLKEIVPVWKIPDEPGLKQLQSLIPGSVTFDRVSCNVTQSALKNNEGATFLLSGEATFSSAMASNGLCDLKGKLRVGGTVAVAIANGKPSAPTGVVTAVGSVSGDYRDPSTGKVVGLLTVLVNAKADLKDATMIPDDDAEPPPGLQVKPYLLKLESIAATAERTVPFASVDAFKPDAITAAIPELHRLQVIKQLLTGFQSGMRNRPDLRKLVKSRLPAYGATDAEVDKALAPFKELKAWAEEAYPLLKIDRPAGAAPAAPPSAE